ncbi:MAG: hypothetical protein C3F06_05820 [Candidatus Methanoperedenaceae archaeon]|nr:MAG: hypothetical protein C3F06_05820 [Candidatus Methanoperedenaceae archaeon]
MQPIKILWVEDDATKLEGMVKPLKRDGHVIFYAEDQTEALELLENNKFDLILIDIIIPTGIKNDLADNHFVGIDLIKKIKEEEKISTPIMVLSVVRDNELIKSIKKMGIENILQKGSLLPSELKKEIYGMLNIK